MAEKLNGKTAKAESIWYSGPAFAKKVPEEALASHLAKIPGSLVDVKRADDGSVAWIALTLEAIHYRVDGLGNEYVLSAEAADLPASAWVPLINHVSEVLGAPIN